MSINFYIKTAEAGRAHTHEPFNALLFITIMLFARSPAASRTR